MCFICRVPIGNNQQTKNTGLEFIGEMFPVCQVLPLSASAYGLDSCDLTHDQMEEILLATTKGLHIYQLDLNEVVKLIENRLEKTSKNIKNGS